MLQDIQAKIEIIATPDYGRTAKTLALAFADDPVMAYIFKGSKNRVQRIESIMHLALKSYGHHSGFIESLESRSVAVWQQPNPAKPSFLSLLLNAVEAVTKLRGSIDRAQKVQQISYAVRPKHPHWYLAILGTEPSFRGKWNEGPSMASCLLTSVLDRCDQQAMPAYLESSNYGNISFYQRHGFQVTQQLELPGGPNMWGMLRQ
jgi:ribosomal protein S18 acetylase RimI-like enzyme